MRNPRVFHPATPGVLADAQAASLVNAISTSSNITGTGVDLTGWEGLVTVAQNLGTITGSISLNKLQDSADNSAWADVAAGVQTGAFGTTASALSSVQVEVRNLRRYVRYIATVTTGPVAVSVTMTGFKKVSG